ncbi:MAG: ATP-binding cassette domain-containing protein [Eubacteriales bacterium]|nr:ATP-binding cassette domain-containing protein [Eubacteriales bacterium]MCI6972061.1 ATP-binding cassette domain-containing protein [Eubacterium sp.]MDD7573930.1 ATP-binding cassette domain-containing protein [Eubacteriales bacterium]MDY5355163.1 ATP-binding cassette domain-containing protein [Eubacteriales bacterium]
MIELRNICKTFEGAGGKVDALHNINLTISDGDIYGIIGMSGAGKSTLVRCINMLERPTEGEVIVDGVNMGELSPSQLREARRGITMIFQGFNLLMQKNCLKNVCFPMELAGIPKADAVKRATELLELVGLPDKAKAYPAQLSGGQQQRVAIARALATNPKVLLCDEATSALDPNTTHSILELIRDINKKLGITVIIITHQMSVVEEVCNHVAILDNGEVVEEGAVGTVFASPKSAAARRLVFPGGADDQVSNPHKEKRLRVVFSGAQAASMPLISSMAIEMNILVNIVSAATRCIDDRTYGSMLLGVPGGEEQAKMVAGYLGSVENVTVEEV